VGYFLRTFFSIETISLPLVTIFWLTITIYWLVYLLLSSLRYASKFLDIFATSMAKCNTGIKLCQGLITERRRDKVVAQFTCPERSRGIGQDNVSLINQATTTQVSA